MLCIYVVNSCLAFVLTYLFILFTYVGSWGVTNYVINLTKAHFLLGFLNRSVSKLRLHSAWQGQQGYKTT